MSAGEIEQQSMSQWLAQRDLPLNLGHDLLSRYLLQIGKRAGEEVDYEMLKTIAMSGFCAGRADRIFSEGERET